eukprot:3189368-Rhodomonas_salina.3
MRVLAKMTVPAVTVRTLVEKSTAVTSIAWFCPTEIVPLVSSAAKMAAASSTVRLVANVVKSAATCVDFSNGCLRNTPTAPDEGSTPCVCDST